MIESETFLEDVFQSTPENESTYWIYVNPLQGWHISILDKFLAAFEDEKTGRRTEELSGPKSKFSECCGYYASHTEMREVIDQEGFEAFFVIYNDDILSEETANRLKERLQNAANVKNLD